MSDCYKHEIGKGDKVFIEVYGAGVVSYEPATVARVRNGKIFLIGEVYPFDCDSRLKLFPNQGALGFVIRVVGKEEDALDKAEFRKAQNRPPWRKGE